MYWLRDQLQAKTHRDVIIACFGAENLAVVNWEELRYEYSDEGTWINGRIGQELVWK